MKPPPSTQDAERKGARRCPHCQCGSIFTDTKFCSQSHLKQASVETQNTRPLDSVAERLEAVQRKNHALSLVINGIIDRCVDQLHEARQCNRQTLRRLVKEAVLKSLRTACDISVAYREASDPKGADSDDESAYAIKEIGELTEEIFFLRRRLGEAEEALRRIASYVPQFEMVIVDVDGRELWIHDFIKKALSSSPPSATKAPQDQGLKSPSDVG